MTKYLLSMLFATCVFSVQSTWTQQPDTVKQAHIKHISKELAVDEKTAGQVVSIMDQYKQNAKAVAIDKNLSEEDRRNKINELIGEKNGKLKKILNMQQLKKIIPTSEKIKEN